jgi:hypothetical protein
LILNSATYQQSSRTTPSTRSGGVLAAFPKRRLEAEVLRDSMLQLAGVLDERFYGESVPTLRSGDGRSVVATNSPDRNRRTVYISTRRTTVPTFLTVFDEPAMDTNWPKRNDSVIPQQALALMNSQFVLDCAKAFAQRVLREGRLDFPSTLERTFLLVYGRPPDRDERALFKSFSEAQPRSETAEQLWSTICHALLSSNEFLYAD